MLVEETIWTPIRETGTVIMSHLENDSNSEPVVVGFHGTPGSGKDTLGQNLCHFYGFKRVSFAGPLKDCMSTLFGFPNEFYESRDKKESAIEGYNNLTPRIVAQLGGDGLKTAFGNDFLVDIAKARILKNTRSQFPVVVTDVRFENEARMIKEQFENSVIIKLDAGSRVTSLGSGANHRSNNPLPPNLIDYTLRTDCTVLESESKLSELLGLGNRYSY